MIISSALQINRVSRAHGRDKLAQAREWKVSVFIHFPVDNFQQYSCHIFGMESAMRFFPARFRGNFS
ncbi:MAG: hypothetical protein PHU46_11460 [Rhodocyclaceae bacterium]|nr:hypothetical protein [Rhodocyclaceae bacterium]